MKSNHRAPDPASKEILEIVLSLVDHLDAMVAYWDTNQVCVFANDAYRIWFGLGGKDVVGMTMAELLGPLYPKNLPYIQAAFAGQTQVFEREITTPSGEIRNSLATYTPHVVDGEVHGIFVHVANVTPLKQIERELRFAKAEAEKLATHDFLTGLPNRVVLEDTMARALSFARHNDQMMALLSLDMDDFKQVNDTYGHGVGDQLLIEIAQRVRDSLRETDTVIRMGGDEFLIVAPQIKVAEQAAAIAERIFEKTHKPFAIEKISLLPKLSLGIALYPLHGATPEDLIISSDRALYLAKELGKNRYAFAATEEA